MQKHFRRDIHLGQKVAQHWTDDYADYSVTFPKLEKDLQDFLIALGFPYNLKPQKPSITYDGSKVKITCATANVDLYYRFSTDDEYIEYTEEFAVASSCTVYAIAVKKDKTSDEASLDVVIDVTKYYTIGVAVAEGQSAYGSVSGGNSYAEGSTATIKAVASSGYEFDSWDDGDTNATRSVVVTEDKTYTASFKAKEQIYYGFVPSSITGFSTLANAKLASITGAMVTSAINAGNMVGTTDYPITSSSPKSVVTSGSKAYFMALVPSSMSYVAKQFDGISAYVAFSDDTNGADYYANGDKTLVVNNVKYNVYAQYAPADATEFKITIS